MSDGTTIEWTDATWNPITGCSVVSAGCKHCYAMKLAGTRLRNHWSRAGLTRETSAGPVWTGETRLNADWLDQPLRWKRARRVFVCAHGDLFHESIPDGWIDAVFAVMAWAHQHEFQVLTKRAARMREYLSQDSAKLLARWADAAVYRIGSRDPDGLYDSIAHNAAFPLPNVWLGVSVEHQAAADERLPQLVGTPAAVRFVSAEPLLGPVHIDPRLLAPIEGTSQHGQRFIDWVIAGGESGAGARPMHPEWAQSLRDQCARAGAAFLFKQWGAWAPIAQRPAGLSDSLYVPIRVARRGEDQDALNDAWGRRCTVPTAVLHNDGTLHGITEPMAFRDGVGAMQAFEVGKGRAGRLLDGQVHDGFPVPAAAVSCP